MGFVPALLDLLRISYNLPVTGFFMRFMLSVYSSFAFRTAKIKNADTAKRQRVWIGCFR